MLIWGLVFVLSAALSEEVMVLAQLCCQVSLGPSAVPGEQV